MQLAPAGVRPSTVRVALFVLAVVVVMSAAEVTSERFKDFTQEHALLSTFLTEAVLLVGVYLVIDEIIERRAARRWRDVMSFGIRALSTRAGGPAEIVQRVPHELLEPLVRREDASEAPCIEGIERPRELLGTSSEHTRSRRCREADGVRILWLAFVVEEAD